MQGSNEEFLIQGSLANAESVFTVKFKGSKNEPIAVLTSVENANIIQVGRIVAGIPVLTSQAKSYSAPDGQGWKRLDDEIQDQITNVI